jgi:RNA polymerase primary sigma factor
MDMTTRKTNGSDDVYGISDAVIGDEIKGDEIKGDEIKGDELDALSEEELLSLTQLVDDSDDLEIPAGYKKRTFDDAFEAYRAHALKIPLLSREQELDFALRAQKGEKFARDKMMLHNLRLVVNIARRAYIPPGMEFSDLVSEGNIGLMTAIERFEPERGFRFTTYATWWIRQAITRSAANQGTIVRLPVHVKNLMNEYYKALRTLDRKELRATDANVAEEMGIKPERAAKIKSVLANGISMNKSPLEGGGESEGAMLQELMHNGNDDVGVESMFNASDRYEVIVLMSKYLTEREYDVLSMRFGLGIEPMTLEDVGRTLNLTRERIRQIESKALKKLRFKLNAVELHRAGESI